VGAGDWEAAGETGDGERAAGELGWEDSVSRDMAATIAEGDL
jgi:hypothetical protein